MNYGTLPSRFLNAVDTRPNPRAQMVRRDGQWEAIASQEFLRRGNFRFLETVKWRRCRGRDFDQQLLSDQL